MDYEKMTEAITTYTIVIIPVHYGNEGHNTVMVDNMNFMRKCIRFIWNKSISVKAQFL